MTAATNIATIEHLMRQAATVAGILAPFAGPLAPEIELGVSAEPIVEEGLNVLAALLGNGADPTTAVAGLSAVFRNISTALANHAVMLPPPSPGIADHAVGPGT